MITFARYQTTRLYQPESETTTNAGYFAYLLLSETSPDTIVLEGSWSQYNGYYLFLKEKPAEEDLAAFAQAVDGNLAPLKGAHTGFTWLSYRASDQSVSILGRIPVKADVTVEANTVLRLANYGAPFKQDSPVVLQVDPAGDEDRFFFEYPPLPGAPPPVPDRDIRLSLHGEWRGCIECEAIIGDFSDDSHHGWNIGCRYFLKQEEKIVSLFYPIFDFEPGTQVLFLMKWDPTDPLNPNRTHLSFGGDRYKLTTTGGPDPVSSIEQVSHPNVLPTHFRTVYGHQVYLCPVVSGNNPARLVFTSLPDTTGNEESYYLSLCGDFELTTSSDAQADQSVQQLLAGLIGTESIQFAPKTKDQPGDLLTFHPGNAAFAPVFPIVGSGAKTSARSSGSTPGDLLDPKYKTSWISAGPNPQQEDPAAPIYFSQPQQSPLFAPNDSGQSGEQLHILAPYPAPAAILSSGTGMCFPMVPYRGKPGYESLSDADLRNFELQILNPTRKEVIGGVAVWNTPQPHPRIAQGSTVTTTPQGLLATVDGLKWLSVLLATNEETGQRLEFADPQGIPLTLKNALQNSELFLVVTKPGPLGKFKNVIDIEGWPFTINVSGAEGNYSNVLIFKFGTGTLEERIKDPLSWTNGNTFNDSTQDVSMWLGDYIDEAKQLAKTDTRYQTFLNIMGNRAWNGILALKVDIGLSSFPEDLKGLLGGIDLTRFYAHHLGIEINYVEPETGGLKIPKSSLFALISYIDPSYASSQGIPATAFRTANMAQAAENEDSGRDGYDFLVLTLQVVFQNSQIKDFSSKIQLTMTKWFAEPAFSDCTIQLIGNYETHNGRRNYTFTTLKDKSYQFFLNSKVVQYIQIVKAQFGTYKKKPDVFGAFGETSEDISSRFSFWGYLNFAEFPEFDMFSFGDETPQAGSVNKGLYFYNLAVQMSFELVSIPSQGGSKYEVRNRNFGFEAENVAFDTTATSLHKNSFYGHFPLTLTGMAGGKKQKKPADLGYVQAEFPDGVGFSPLGDEWYGIIYTLNLGSMGALASKAGFTAGVLVAWSPGTEKTRASIGIRLPGSGGKKELSFESVLRLSTDGFKFKVHTDLTGGIYYSLTLRSIALSLLGIKLPPGGNTSVVLFGAPGKGRTTLGWYGAYYQKKTEKRPALPSSVPKGE
jgi:hypothetical protein